MRRALQISLILFILLDLIAIAGLSYLIIASKGAADAKNTELVDFEVESGQSAGDIAMALEDKGIISSKFYFTFYLIWNDEAGNLKSGSYELSPSMAIPEVVAELKTGRIKQVNVTIPEGLRTSEVEAILVDAGFDLRKGELTDAVNIKPDIAHKLFAFNFFLDLPKSATIDGFLFPDTYTFEKSTELNAIIEKMMANFSIKVTDAMRVKIKADGRTLYDTVKVASLLEREVQTYEDMKIVAGILYKRLDIGMPLQVDATLIYITSKKGSELTNADKLIDSPYNTYLYRGLPPTPINNPGLNAINSAINPVETEFLYYLSTPDGETIFSKTLDEHNANRAKFLRL